MHATGQMSGQASGQWSAAGGTLTLCMTDVSSKGTIEMKGPNGEDDEDCDAADEACLSVNGLHLQRRHAVDRAADAEEHRR